MNDFDSLMETLLSAIGETPQMDHGPQNRPSEVRRILHKLRQSPLIDQPSFLANFRAILQIKGDGGATQGQIARMFDRFAEFRVAEHFVTMVTGEFAEGLLIAFSEAPDIHVTVGGQGLQFGVEVKRPRLRAQDHVDEANLPGVTREDTLMIYGNPKHVQEDLEEKVFKKAEVVLHRSPTIRWILFIVNDSQHQVEDVEVQAAAWHRYVYEGVRCKGLCGIGIRDRGAAAMIPRLFIWEETEHYKDILAFLGRGFNIDVLSA